jgi:hypothetical protein
MKAKWISGILAVLMISLIFSTTRGSDKFYYGGFHVEAVPGKFQEMKDSLRFNLVLGGDVQDYIDSLANASLQAVAEQSAGTSPSYWSARSHYTVLEAEGYPGSYYGFTYTGGSKVWDPYASGDTAMLFSVSEDSLGLIQTGPWYNQEPGPSVNPIQYTAEFRLKSPDYLAPNDTVCVLKVVGGPVDNDTVLAQRVVYSSQFTDSLDYKTFAIDYFVTRNPIEFQIYWLGERTLYIDYVKVYDENGEYVMSGAGDSDIVAYVNQDWVKTTIPATGDTVVYRWYMRDEPPSIDCYRPYAYIDSILQDTAISGPHIPGAQFFGGYFDTPAVHDYLLRSDPVEYMIDPYPFRWDDSPSNYQTRLSEMLIRHYYEGKLAAESRNKDLWLAIQSHAVGKQKVDTCYDAAEYEYPPGSGTYYCVSLRDPTPNEVRLQTFLALCYGADGVMNYRASYALNTINPDSAYLETGLYDQYRGVATPKWEEIKNFTGPRMERIGSIIANLTWLGAGFHEDVATITGSFMDSLKAAPAETLSTTYVEVGFFEDDADTNYFMLVNRQCLESENQSVIAYLDSAALDEGKMWYVIDQYSQETTFTGAIDGEIPFTTHLEPGEGKLFKLVPFPDSAFHGTAQPLTWQGGIMADGGIVLQGGSTPQTSRKTIPQP